MEMAQVLEEKFPFLGRRLFEIDPEEKIRVRQQGRHEKPLDVLGVQAALRGECKRADHAARVILFKVPSGRETSDPCRKLHGEVAPAAS
jgi:hypothetical protein